MPQIETKFGRGDSVSVIWQDEMTEKCPKCGHRTGATFKWVPSVLLCIIDLSVTVDEKGVDIRYWFKGQTVAMFSMTPEPFCFATVPEAQAECDRRNKEDE